MNYQLLYQHLEIKDLLFTFDMLLRQNFGTTGILYRNSDLNIKIEYGNKSGVMSRTFSLGQNGDHGTLSIFTRNDVERVSDILLSTAIAHIGVPLKNSIKYEKALENAYRDELTGCHNRKVIQDLYVNAYSQAQRNNHYLSVSIIDIDHFKSVNDTHGHMIGDEALKYVSSMITSYSRSNDYIIRFGGEEFVMISTSECEDGGFNHVDSLRKRLSDNPMLLDNIILPLTFSAGTFTIDTSHPYTLDESIQQADDLLYISKESGRNMVNTNVFPDYNHVILI